MLDNETKILNKIGESGDVIFTFLKETYKL